MGRSWACEPTSCPPGTQRRKKKNGSFLRLHPSHAASCCFHLILGSEKKRSRVWGDHCPCWKSLRAVHLVPHSPNFVIFVFLGARSINNTNRPRGGVGLRYFQSSSCGYDKKKREHSFFSNKKASSSCGYDKRSVTDFSLVFVQLFIKAGRRRTDF